MGLNTPSKHVRQKYMSINSKLKHYKTVIRPQALYASECISLNRMKEVEQMRKREREIVRKIIEPKREGEVWKRKSNIKVYKH